MDRAEMCGEVLRRMGIKVGEDDPAFLLVELNRLALEEAVAVVVERLAPLPNNIVEAGRALAVEVSTSSLVSVSKQVAEARQTIATEAQAARAAAAKAISEIVQTHRRAHAGKWIALGLFSAVVLVAVGHMLALASIR